MLKCPLPSKKYLFKVLKILLNVVILFQRDHKRFFAVSSFCMKNRGPPYFLTVIIVIVFPRETRPFMFISIIFAQ